MAVKSDAKRKTNSIAFGHHELNETIVARRSPSSIKMNELIFDDDNNLVVQELVACY